MADIECPSCGTLLRNVQPGPEGHLRCLNCGKRFAAAASGAASSDANAVSAAANLPPGREPAAGSYGLLVVFAYLLSAGLVLLGFLTAWDLYPAAGTTAWSGRQDYLGRILMAFGALFGPPCLGAACVHATRLLSRIETHALRIAWRSGVLANSLPPLKGSSLPYILPFGVAGGLQLVLAFMTLARTDGPPANVKRLAQEALAGATVILLGLALSEARRFLWRMEQTALRLAASSSTASASQVQIAAASLSGAWGLVLTGCAACIFYRFGSFYQNMSNVDVVVWIGWTFFLCGGTCSLWWLSLDALRAASAWHRAVGGSGAGAGPQDLRNAGHRRRLHFDKTGAFVLLAATWALCALAVCYRMVAYDNFKYYTLAYTQAILLFPAALLALLLAWSAFGLWGLSETLRPWAGSPAARQRPLLAAGPVFWLGLAFLWGALNRDVRSYYGDSHFAGAAISTTGWVIPALWAALVSERLWEIAQRLMDREQNAPRDAATED